MHLVAEMLDHDLGLLLDIVRVQAHELGERPRRFFLRQVRIVLRRLQQPVIHLIRRIVGQDVEDEFLLDCLPHAVGVSRLGLAARPRPAKQFQCFGFGRRRESEEAEVRLSPARFHDRVKSVFPIALLVFTIGLPGAEDCFQLARGFAGLAGMGFIDDHCVAPSGNSRFPFFRLPPLFVCRVVPGFGAGSMQQAA